MKSARIFLTVVFVLPLLQSGCSAQTVSSNPSKKENQNNVVSTDQPAKKSESHYIIGGLTQGESQGLATALEQAEISSAPILKASRFEQEQKWNEAIEAYKEAMTFDRHKGAARIGLARIYEKLGNYKQAIEQLELALPQINDWAKPEYEKKLSELKIKASQKN